MSSPKVNWIFSLVWINTAVAIVVLIRLLGNQIVDVHDLVYTLGYSLVFANLTGILALLAVSALAPKVQIQRLPLFPLTMFIIIVFVPLGCLLAQALLLATGLFVPQNFWLEYLHILSVSMPLAAVFGLGSLVHAVLRERLKTAEEKLHEKEVAEGRAQKLAAEARLSSLESRIHPHFLFNTLNSISSTIAVNPARAEQIVGRLATLLRASLDSSNQSLIPLRQELEMVESYLDIEKARFGDKLRGSTKIADEFLSVGVPPMSVQVLVENAVKHGITPQRGGGEILVTAFPANENLRIEVSDTGPGFTLTAIPAGHGLDNLVERLDSLFGSKAQLNVFRRDGQSVVEMVLPRV